MGQYTQHTEGMMGYFNDLAIGPYRTTGEADEDRTRYPDEYVMVTQAETERKEAATKRRVKEQW